MSHTRPAWLQPGGSGNGAVNYTVASNIQLNGSTQPRTGTLTVSGSDSSGKTVFTQPFGVQEAGLACAYTLNPPALSVPPEGILQGTAAKISVTTSPACQWTASSSSISMHLIQSGSGPNTGSGTVLFWVDANSTGADRT
jgi:Putative binding domain, N-terminal